MPAPVMDEKELNEFIADLESGPPQTRADVLWVLRRSPSRDARILPHLERLLADTTPCLLSIPLTYGELRWLAAHALLSERIAQSIDEPVRLSQVVAPIGTNEMGMLARDAGIRVPGSGTAAELLTFAELRDREKLPRRDFTAEPALYRKHGQKP